VDSGERGTWRPGPPRRSPSWPPGKPGALTNIAAVTAINVMDPPNSDDSATATVTVHGSD
jgi:hypothetical protein